MNNSPQNIKAKVYRYKGKVKVKIEFEIEGGDKGEIKARLDLNKYWMLHHLCYWADFDFYFTIELLSSSLENLGKGLIRWDNCVNSLKQGRRCLSSSRLLAQAYDLGLKDITSDKSYMKWFENNPLTWKLSGKGRKQALTVPVAGNSMGLSKEEYSDKMWHVIHSRRESTEKLRKKEVWEFIHKHIESWWD